MQFKSICILIVYKEVYTCICTYTYMEFVYMYIINIFSSVNWLGTLPIFRFNFILLICKCSLYVMVLSPEAYIGQMYFLDCYFSFNFMFWHRKVLKFCVFKSISVFLCGLMLELIKRPFPSQDHVIQGHFFSLWCAFFFVVNSLIFWNLFDEFNFPPTPNW